MGVTGWTAFNWLAIECNEKLLVTRCSDSGIRKAGHFLTQYKTISISNKIPHQAVTYIGWK